MTIRPAFLPYLAISLAVIVAAGLSAVANWHFAESKDILGNSITRTGTEFAVAWLTSFILVLLMEVFVLATFVLPPLTKVVGQGGSRC